MSILNPVKLCLISFISLLTFPLAILAGLTTVVAFSILLFRVSLVYVDFFVSFIPTYVFGRHTYSRRLRDSKSSPIIPGPDSPSSTTSYARRRRRRRLSSASAEPPTPTLVAEPYGLGILGAGMDRDFEGLGGWRDGDDELWTNINSRFQLSEGRPVQVLQHHHRTLSGGGILRGEGARGGRQGARSPGSTTPVAPNTSKVRRPAPPNGVPPPFTAVGEDTFR